MDSFLPHFRSFGLLTVFLGLLACGLGLPIPEEVFLLGGGILLENWTGYWTMTLASMSAILLGDTLAYILGRYHTSKIYRFKLVKKILGSEKQLSWIQRHFDGHAMKTIFVARFLPGVRAPTFFFAGGHGVSYFRFFLMDFLAAAVSVPTSIGIAWYFKENMEEAREKMREFHLLVFAALAVAVAAGIFLYYRRKKKREKNDRPAPPTKLSENRT